MPPIDSNNLVALLNAANSQTLKKMMEEVAKAKKAVDDARANLAEVDRRLQDAIPPELKALLAPSAPAKATRSAGNPAKEELKKLDLPGLRQILDTRPGNTLNIRQEGFDSKVVKDLVRAYPDLLAYEKGTWPKVKYLR